MDEEQFENEIWDELQQASLNLCYLDEFRSRKARIEPIYKAILGIASCLSVIAQFIDIKYMAIIMTVLTAITAIAPLLFPVLPVAEDFSKMDDLRNEAKKRLLELETYWNEDITDKQYNNYKRTKAAYIPTETSLAALFGKINGGLYKKALHSSEVYLARFYK